MNRESVEPAVQQFFASVTQLMDVSEEAHMAMTQALVPKRFIKGQFLVNAGEVNGEFLYIYQGLVRFVYNSEDGREFNKSFAAENGFIGCLRSMLTQQPCRFAIQALEPTQTLSLTSLARESLWKNYPEWERLGRLLAERLALKKEEREAQFLLDSVEQRYQQFLAEYRDKQDTHYM